MTRFYQCFKTQEERASWEKDMKRKNPNFKVCMRMPVKQLEKEMGMPPETLSNKFSYATIYRFKESWEDQG